MFARIKPRAVVWIRSNPEVWGSGDFIKGWKYLSTEARQDYSKEVASKIFEVEKYFENRRCILIANGYGSKSHFGQGPIKVRSEDLVILKDEYAQSHDRLRSQAAD